MRPFTNTRVKSSKQILSSTRLATTGITIWTMTTCSWINWTHATTTRWVWGSPTIINILTTVRAVHRFIVECHRQRWWPKSSVATVKIRIQDLKVKAGSLRKRRINTAHSQAPTRSRPDNIGRRAQWTVPWLPARRAKADLEILRSAAWARRRHGLCARKRLKRNVKNNNLFRTASRKV